MHFGSKRTLWWALLLVFLLPGTHWPLNSPLTWSFPPSGRRRHERKGVRERKLPEAGLETPNGVQSTIIPPGTRDVCPSSRMKMYMEMQNTQVTLDGSENLEAKMAEQGKVTKKGTETMEAFPATCTTSSTTTKAGGRNVWVSRELNYPLKIYTKNPQDTATILYRNIRKGKLDDGLFSLPPGYTKFSM